MKTTILPKNQSTGRAGSIINGTLNKALLRLVIGLLFVAAAAPSISQTNQTRLDPKAFVAGDVRYINENAKRLFSEADLPVFLEILGDANRPFREYYAAMEAIAAISPKNNDRVVNALAAFLKRPLNWEKWVTNQQGAAEVLRVKGWALTAIGLVGGDQAETILKRIITVTGAQEFTRSWIGGWPADHPFVNQEDVLSSIRGSAAYALARFDRGEDIVRAEYAKERQSCVKSGKTSHYLSGLISAMSLIDCRKEVGEEGAIPASLMAENLSKYELNTATNKAPSRFSDPDARERFLAIERFARLSQAEQAGRLPEFYYGLSPLFIGMFNFLSSFPHNILEGAQKDDAYDGSTELWAQQLADASSGLSPEQIADKLKSGLWLDVASRARVQWVLNKHSGVVSNLVSWDLQSGDTNAVERAKTAALALKTKSTP